jgi:hypothetical protein
MEEARARVGEDNIKASFLVISRLEISKLPHSEITQLVQIKESKMELAQVIP